jgi:hypothetical protein
MPESPALLGPSGLRSAADLNMRFLDAIAVAEMREPGFAGSYGLQIVEDPPSADTLVQEQGLGHWVPDDPSHLAPGSS